MSSKPRRQFTTDQKVAVLRRHFVDKVPVSQLCEEAELQPSVFYSWQKQAFENLAGALQPAATTSSREKDLEREFDRNFAAVWTGSRTEGKIASVGPGLSEIGA